MLLDRTAAFRIRDARHRANLTLEQVAAKAPCSIQTLVNIETGHIKSPQGRTIYRIAAALELDPLELVYREPDDEMA